MASVHAWELDRIANEEDRQIIEDEVLIAFFGEEFCRPAADIANRIARALLATNSRDPGKNWSLLSDSIQKFRICDIAVVVCHFEFA